MTEHDVLVGFRLRLFTLAEELGNVSAACRAMGVHRSTYYRLKRKVDRWGLEALTVRERRRPRMPNQIGPHLEQRIVAFALGPPWPRAAADLGRAGPGEVGRHPDLRARRLARAAPGGAEHALQAPGAGRPPPRPLRAQAAAARSRSATSRPLSPARRSSSTASTSVGCRAPRARSGSTRRSTSPPPMPGPSCGPPSATPAPATRASCCTASPASSRRPAGSCARSTTDNGSEFRSREFGDAVEAARRPPALHQGRQAELQRLRRAPPADDPRGVLAARLRPLARPQDDRTPTRPRRIPHDYNFDRAHTGRLTKGRVPADIVFGARKTRPVR